VCVTPEKLQAFLEATHDLDMPLANRLRWLATELEYLKFEQGWKGLRAISKAAAEADPADPLVLHSWGISATNWTEEWMTPDLLDHDWAQVLCLVLRQRTLQWKRASV
jgi:hypothetical protein